MNAPRFQVLAGNGRRPGQWVPAWPLETFRIVEQLLSMCVNPLEAMMCRSCFIMDSFVCYNPINRSELKAQDTVHVFLPRLDQSWQATRLAAPKGQ